MDSLLTARAKTAACTFGAHLVGVGNIERWENCPPLMSPAGIMPDARSVLVCGIHHTDAMIEIGGEANAHEQGAYLYQLFMNRQLDIISYSMGRWLEEHGWRAVPVVASNIWRYRPYKEQESTFAPDMSHIYASVAAGLTELGWSGLAMSPEYGPRNRFVSIITDAPLVPTPLLPGNSLCDRCNMCVSRCPTMAFTKEVRGEVALHIEENAYMRCEKNLWRCAWAEHFGLSIDADIPETVDEGPILESIERLGLRGGTMGSCLKYCLPRDKRNWDRDYSSAPVRKKGVRPAGPQPERHEQMMMIAGMLDDGADRVVIRSREELEALGVEVDLLLPDAQSAVLVSSRAPETDSDSITNWDYAGLYQVQKPAFYAAHHLEKLGYSAAPYLRQGFNEPTRKAALDKLGEFADSVLEENPEEHRAFLLTSAELEREDRQVSASPLPPHVDAGSALRDLAVELGADLVGIGSASRLADMTASIRSAFDGDPILDARDTGGRWMTPSAEITERKRVVRTPEDHLSGAKSVIVLGARVPRESVACLGREPAEPIGPYSFAQHQTHRRLARSAFRLMKAINGWGWRCAATSDLCGTGSVAANPRGPQPNIFCNRFAAVAAGLGTLTKGGFVNTEAFGPNIRFTAIVVDAELPEDPVADLTGLREECTDCNRCLQHCSVHAFRDVCANLEVGETTLPYHPVEQVRCDWALRYALVPEEGGALIGSRSDAPIPDRVTAEALTEGMKKQDPILRVRPCVAEMCSLACPYTRSQD